MCCSTSQRKSQLLPKSPYVDGKPKQGVAGRRQSAIIAIYGVKKYAAGPSWNNNLPCHAMPCPPTQAHWILITKVFGYMRGSIQQISVHRWVSDWYKTSLLTKQVALNKSNRIATRTKIVVDAGYPWTLFPFCCQAVQQGQKGFGAVRASLMTSYDIFWFVYLHTCWYICMEPCSEELLPDQTLKDRWHDKPCLDLVKRTLVVYKLFCHPYIWQANLVGIAGAIVGFYITAGWERRGYKSCLSILPWYNLPLVPSCSLYHYTLYHFIIVVLTMCLLNH